MDTVTIHTGEGSYPVFIGAGLLDEAALVAPFLGPSRVLIVSNEVVAPLYLQRVRELVGQPAAAAVILEDGEEHKSRAGLELIHDRLVRDKYDRQSTLIALGGGVVGDIAGFAAATYQRGIRYLQIPTTLLAQVDSSVGGKTAINHPLGKNMIGAFHQPACVLADTDTLHTLPQRQIRAGLAEVLKYGLLGDGSFFAWLKDNSESILAGDAACLRRVIRTCCEAKARIVAQDEKETGVRALLNLGHTFGHAIETATGYGAWLHGEAVAMGMVMAADLSMRKGWLSRQDAGHVREVLEQAFGLPVVPPPAISCEEYLEIMSVDKKAEGGRIRFVLLRAIGEAVIATDVEQDLLARTLGAGEGLCR